MFMVKYCILSKKITCEILIIQYFEHLYFFTPSHRTHCSPPTYSQYFVICGKQLYSLSHRYNLFVSIKLKVFLICADSLLFPLDNDYFHGCHGNTKRPRMNERQKKLLYLETIPQNPQGVLSVYMIGGWGGGRGSDRAFHCELSKDTRA